MLTTPTVGFFKTLQENGLWTYTLTTLLGEWLHQAEQQFGARDQGWTVLGVEVGGDRPCVWYPGGKERKHVAVELSARCQNEEVEARYELAQEIVHLLAPNGGGSALVIEEGIATLFANQVGPRPITNASYVNALKHVEALLALDPDAIKTLRKERPKFQDFTPEFIKEHIVIPDQLASDLCEIYKD